MSDDQVVTLYVKVHLHNILEIDDEGQQFMADVSVTAWAPLRGPDKAVIWNIGEEHDPKHNTPSYMPEFTITNIKDADQIEEESFSYSDTAEGQFIKYSCRWRGTFLEEFELQDFPFDMQEYSLRIEAMSNGFFTNHKGVCDERHRKTVLKPVSQCGAAFLRRNPSIFTYSNFNMQNEWTLPHGVEGGIRKIDDRFIVDIKPSDGSGETDPRISSHSPPRPLDNYKNGIPYPTLTARIFLIRKPQAFVYNVALPMLVLTTLCGACWGTPPTELDDRLSITLTLMLTAVAQKFAGSAGLPKISYLTLLDKYLLGCLFCIVLMACENFAISLVDAGDDVKHTKMDDTLMLVWLGIWAAFNLATAIMWWRAVRRNKPDWRLQKEARNEQAEADRLKEEAERLEKEAEQLESHHKYLEAAQLFDEAAQHSPRAGDKVDLKKRAEHARADADRMQSERPAYRGERR